MTEMALYFPDYFGIPGDHNVAVKRMLRYGVRNGEVIHKAIIVDPDVIERTCRAYQIPEQVDVGETVFAYTFDGSPITTWGALIQSPYHEHYLLSAEDLMNMRRIGMSPFRG